MSLETILQTIKEKLTESQEDLKIKTQNFKFIEKRKYKKLNLEILQLGNEQSYWIFDKTQKIIIQAGNNSNNPFLKNLITKYKNKPLFVIPSLHVFNDYPRDKKTLEDNSIFSDLPFIYNKLFNQEQRLNKFHFLGHKSNPDQNNNTLNSQLNNLIEYYSNDTNKETKKIKPITLDKKDFIIKEENYYQIGDYEFQIESKKITIKKNNKTILKIKDKKQLKKEMRQIKKNLKKHKKLKNIIDNELTENQTLLVPLGTGNANSTKQFGSEISLIRKKEDTKYTLNIDSYLTPKEYSTFGLEPSEIDTIAITHRHEDHIKGLTSKIYYFLTKKFKNKKFKDKKLKISITKRDETLLKRLTRNTLIKSPNKEETYKIYTKLTNQYLYEKTKNQTTPKPNSEIILNEQKIPVLMSSEIEYNHEQKIKLTKDNKLFFFIEKNKSEHVVETRNYQINTKPNKKNIFISSDLTEQNLEKLINHSKDNTLTIVDGGGILNDPVHPDNNYLRQLIKEQKTVFLTTHLPDERSATIIRLRQGIPYLIEDNYSQELNLRSFFKILDNTDNYETISKNIEDKNLKIIQKLPQILTSEQMLSDENKIKLFKKLDNTYQKLKSKELSNETLLLLDNLEEFSRYYKDEIFGYKIDTSEILKQQTQKIFEKIEQLQLIYNPKKQENNKVLINKIKDNIKEGKINTINKISQGLENKIKKEITKIQEEHKVTKEQILPRIKELKELVSRKEFQTFKRDQLTERLRKIKRYSSDLETIMEDPITEAITQIEQKIREKYNLTEEDYLKVKDAYTNTKNNYEIQKEILNIYNNIYKNIKQLNSKLNDETFKIELKEQNKISETRKALKTQIDKNIETLREIREEKDHYINSNKNNLNNIIGRIIPKIRKTEYKSEKYSYLFYQPK